MSAARPARRTPKRVRANYPGKEFLTWSEAMQELNSGPLPAWFAPWAEQGIILPGITRASYGYLHVYGTDWPSFNYDFAAFPDHEGLNWGLAALYGRHGDCPDCRGVLYFTPDKPLRLYAVIEQDGEGEENPEWTVVTRAIGDSTAGDEVES